MTSKKKEIGISTIKSLFGIIPYAGNVLDEIFFEHRSRIKQDRLNKFIELLANYFEEKTPNFKLENLKTEEFSDVLESVLKKVMETSSKEKLERFKNILIGQMHQENIDNDFIDTFLDLTAKLSEAQIFILEEFHRKEIMNKELSQIKNNLRREVFDKQEELRKLEMKSDDTQKSDVDLSRLADEVNHLIAEQSQAEINALENYKYIKAEYYKLSDEDFEFYTQDLVSKSLMRETHINSKLTGINGVKHISEFGIRYLRFIKQE